MKHLTLLLAFAVAFFAAGCAHLTPAGPYHGDKYLFTSDASVAASYSTVDAFLSFELAHRAELAKTPEVGKAADNIRANYRRWRDSYFALRDAYALSPTAANRTALERALSVIIAASTEAQKYLSK